jgi:hypothetical protein
MPSVFSKHYLAGGISRRRKAVRKEQGLKQGNKAGKGFPRPCGGIEKQTGNNQTPNFRRDADTPFRKTFNKKDVIPSPGKKFIEENNKRLYPISEKVFTRRVLLIIEGNYIWKRHPSKYYITRCLGYNYVLLLCGGKRRLWVNVKLLYPGQGRFIFFDFWVKIEVDVVRRMRLVLRLFL